MHIHTHTLRILMSNNFPYHWIKATPSSFSLIILILLVSITCFSSMTFHSSPCFLCACQTTNAPLQTAPCASVVPYAAPRVFLSSHDANFDVVVLTHILYMHFTRAYCHLPWAYRCLPHALQAHNHLLSALWAPCRIFHHLLCILQALWPPLGCHTSLSITFHEHNKPTSIASSFSMPNSSRSVNTQSASVQEVLELTRNVIKDNKN